MNGQAAPDYLRAMDAIKSRIQSGSIGIGSLIIVKQVAEIAGTTYSTARRAVGHLVDEGILRPHQGKGYEVIATPEKVAAERVGTKELGTRLARLEGQVQALEFNLEALYGKNGIPYPGDGTSEREDSKPAARRGRTG